MTRSVVTKSILALYKGQNSEVQRESILRQLRDNSEIAEIRLKANSEGESDSLTISFMEGGNDKLWEVVTRLPDHNDASWNQLLAEYVTMGYTVEELVHLDGENGFMHCVISWKN